MTKNGSKHPDSNLQLPWNITQVGTLILPLMPALGVISISLALLITWGFKYKTLIRRPFIQGFGIFSLLLVVTTLFAQEKIPALLGLPNFLPFILLLCACNVLIQTPAQLRRLAWILVITSIPVTLLGFWQMLGLKTPELIFNIFGWTIAPGGNPVGRMASVFMYANVLAGYLVIVFILACGLWLEKISENKGISYSALVQTRNFASLHSSLFLTIAVILNFAALILTNSRNAWLIAILACVAYAVFKGWRLIVGFFGAVTASVLLAAFAPAPIAGIFRSFVPAFFWARLNDQMYPDRPVELMRTTQWQFAWSMAQQRPLTGWGLRNFTPLYQEKMHIWLGHPHNFFLMLSAETGIPNTLLFIGLIIWILIASARVLRQSICSEQDKLIFFSYFLVVIAWVIFNTVDVSLFDLRLNTLSWLLLGAVAGVSYRYNHIKQEIDT
ncbi:O-antigen polymerase [Calothrix sp. NIES-4071]|nr:O-antigen polymerase [Calothrix sp. NIES-4071]BAZ60370.1 O-antigen polymerase [Calothrix sp. NIES-4105]